jgi:hypothetical protein
MVTHHNEKIWAAMKDNDKRVALIRLRDTIYSGVRPTVRECGFSAENVEELIKEGLILPSGKMSGDESGRNVIEEILPAGHAFILQHRTFHDPRNLPPVPA